MMWIARTGAQWRHLPDEYGEWNSVFRRYRRWVTTGVFDAMLETLAELAGRDIAADMIDSTVIRAHHCALGMKRGLSKQKLSADNRRNPAPHDRAKYRWRNLIERLFNKLKNWRRVATRYDKTKESDLGFVALASIKLWIPFVHEA